MNQTIVYKIRLHVFEQFKTASASHISWRKEVKHLHKAGLDISSISVPQVTYAEVKRLEAQKKSLRPSV